mmetsp:Transcript_31515/g.62295  ORF Transcript_31515/g.62295 Transcript_31515/m.62295 type:complete len:278 (+) Transcript_31515:1907-2740(+)
MDISTFRSLMFALARVKLIEGRCRRGWTDGGRKARGQHGCSAVNLGKFSRKEPFGSEPFWGPNVWHAAHRLLHMLLSWGCPWHRREGKSGCQHDACFSWTGRVYFLLCRRGERCCSEPVQPLWGGFLGERGRRVLSIGCSRLLSFPRGDFGFDLLERAFLMLGEATLRAEPIIARDRREANVSHSLHVPDLAMQNNTVPSARSALLSEDLAWRTYACSPCKETILASVTSVFLWLLSRGSRRPTQRSQEVPRLSGLTLAATERHRFPPPTPRCGTCR